MRRMTALLLAFSMMILCAACGKAEEAGPEISIEPQEAQMKAICELAVMDCYYHNVAKYKEEDAAGFWLWKKDKHFWIEYSGVVRFGIDVSALKIESNGDEITITLPEAKVLSCKVDSSSLTEDSYIVDKKSADITAEDENAAFAAAQKKLEEAAAGDRALLSKAQQRARTLLEDYINNIGDVVGKEYKINWIYTAGEGLPAGGVSGGTRAMTDEAGTEGNRTNGN